MWSGRVVVSEVGLVGLFLLRGLEEEECFEGEIGGRVGIVIGRGYNVVCVRRY